MGKLSNDFKKLCAPAAFYFIVSIVGLIVMVFQNMGSSNVFYLGSYSAAVTSTTLLLVLKFIYILFWTWILQLICKDGHKGIAWFLVLVPFILIFLLFLMLFSQRF
jgi:H+/Cl- antiporter ClcA